MISSPSKGLYEAKLKGLARSILADELELVDAPGAAGGIVASVDESTGQVVRRGYFLVGPDPRSNQASSAGLDTKSLSQIRGLGPALIWADRNQIDELNLFAEEHHAADLARRARLFEPSPIVWEIRHTELALVEPAELVPPPELALADLEFAPTMTEAGTRPVDDHGRLVAEIAGLEVARVSSDNDGSYLEVGVGQADRELQMLVHSGLERVVALERAVGMVLEHRRLNAPLHPLNRLARERWLRWEILKDPSIIGLVSAEPLPPLRPRSTLLGTEPCALVGVNPAGETVLAVCSVGVDVDLAAEAAEYRSRDSPGSEILLVVPESDQHPAVKRTVERLNRASFVSFSPPWGTPL